MVLLASESVSRSKNASSLTFLSKLDEILLSESDLAQPSDSINSSHAGQSGADNGVCVGRKWRMGGRKYHVPPSLDRNSDFVGIDNAGIHLHRLSVLLWKSVQ